MECFLLLKKSLDSRLREDDEKSCIAISVGQGRTFAIACKTSAAAASLLADMAE